MSEVSVVIMHSFVHLHVVKSFVVQLRQKKKKFYKATSNKHK